MAKLLLVETSPKTKRKCGSRNNVDNGCKDVLFGANSMLACYCDNGDYCNDANAVKSNNVLAILVSISSTKLFFSLR